MIGECKLCKLDKDLQLSHIVPKSIYKWIKKTSGSGRMRRGSNMNVPVQDGLKFYLLCKECEQLFSPYEKYFMEEVFTKINDAECISTFSYDSRLFYFLASVWWRITIKSLEGKEVKNCKFVEDIYKCEKSFRNFLLTYSYPKEFDQNYLILVDYVESAPNEMKNLNTFFTRTVDPWLMFDDTSCFLSLRIPKLWFFCNIKGLSARYLEHIKILAEGGYYLTTSKVVSDKHLSPFMNQRLTAYNRMLEKVSKYQVEKINQDHVNKKDKFLNSKSFEAWKRDVDREK